MLILAGDNPERIRSEAAFANALGGVELERGELEEGAELPSPGLGLLR